MIWKKLLVSYLIILSFLLIIAGASVYSLNMLYKKTDIIVKEVIPLSEDVSKPDKSIMNLQNSVMQFIMDQNESNLENWDRDKKQLKSAFKTGKDYHHKYPQIQKAMKKQEMMAEKMIRFYEEQIELVNGFDVVTAQMNINKSNKMMEEYRSSKESTSNLINQINLQSLDSAREIKSKILIFSIAVSVATMIIILVIAYQSIRGISHPIRKVSEILGRISNGDLTVKEIETSRKDEVGDMIRSLNKMITDLRFTVSKVSESALQVASQSEQLNVNAEQGRKSTEISSKIARNTVQSFELQQQEIQKISLSIREMSSSIQDISDSSIEMISVTEQATLHTSEGSAAVKNVATQMAEISLSVDDTTEIIQELGIKSKEIDSIVNMITTISEQTNLLALNAAIEAARAGKHGNGFNVVAKEIRKLAVESKKSSTEISNMITNIQEKISTAVFAMEKSKQKIRNGLSNTTEANNALLSLEESINNTYEKGAIVRTSIMQVENISLEIVDTVGQVQDIVNESVSNLHNSRTASEEQLATIEEVSLSTNQLANLADQLQDLIDNFQIEGKNFHSDMNESKEESMDPLSSDFSQITVAEAAVTIDEK